MSAAIPEIRRSQPLCPAPCPQPFKTPLFPPTRSKSMAGRAYRGISERS